MYRTRRGEQGSIRIKSQESAASDGASADSNAWGNQACACNTEIKPKDFSRNIAWSLGRRERLRCDCQRRFSSALRRTERSEWSFRTLVRGARPAPLGSRAA